MEIQGLGVLGVGLVLRSVKHLFWDGKSGMLGYT
jgi:hypothetical protein